MGFFTTRCEIDGRKRSRCEQMGQKYSIITYRSHKDMIDEMEREYDEKCLEYGHRMLPKCPHGMSVDDFVKSEYKRIYGEPKLYLVVDEQITYSEDNSIADKKFVCLGVFSDYGVA